MNGFQQRVGIDLRTPNDIAAERRTADDREREKVARAICSACKENPYHVGDAGGNAHRWEDYLEAADAAIAAIGTERA